MGHAEADLLSWRRACCGPCRPGPGEPGGPVLFYCCFLCFGRKGPCRHQEEWGVLSLVGDPLQGVPWPQSVPAVPKPTCWVPGPSKCSPGEGSGQVIYAVSGLTAASPGPTSPA